MEKKIIIIGSSIAGASAACLLAKHCDVVVYEQKAQEDIGKKLCANVVTPSYIEHVEKLGIVPEKFVVSVLKHAHVISPNNSISLKTMEFKVNRQKLIETMIKKAQENCAKFSFETEFIGFEKKSNYAVKLRKKGKTFTDSCDILIGADGALSNVAKKAGLWKNRRLWLAVQTEVPLKKLKKYNIKKDSYYLYLGKEKYGYYSYIFSTKNKAVIGMGDRPEEVREKFISFLKSLGIKNKKFGAALIPEPMNVPFKKDLFLIGDAGCHIKFSGGGFIPAIASAEAVRDIILKKDYRKIRELRRRTFFNRLVGNAVWNSKGKDLDNLLDVLNEKKFDDLLIKRDEFDIKNYKKVLFDFRLLRFIFKIF